MPDAPNGEQHQALFGLTFIGAALVLFAVTAGSSSSPPVKQAATCCPPLESRTVDRNAHDFLTKLTINRGG